MYCAKYTGNMLACCLCIILALPACTTSQRGLFAKKTEHEKYADRITQAGLSTSTLGSLWFTAADKALNRPLSVSLPYKETGYFAAHKPDAAGYVFAARRGDQLNILVQAKPEGRVKLFADLWKPAASQNSKPSLLSAADSSGIVIRYEVEQDGNLLLRLQPELLNSVGYTISITTAPSLAFPVSGAASRIGSFWGDNRDGGRRSHEGIDIFSKFRTPLLAAANGVITSTRENNLGGKVIFLRPQGKTYLLYYAHLDEQLVREGQEVAVGDTIGFMGNTGNARNTPSHLHFGIYSGGGAIDPLPFINKNRPSPLAVAADTGILQQNVRSLSAAVITTAPTKNSTAIEKLPPNSIMQLLAATGGFYKVALPGNKEGFVESKFVSTRTWQRQQVKATAFLHDAPDASAAIKSEIKTGETVDVMGTYGSFRYIRYNNQEGWVSL
ncbi:M23 family metallopeptidase [Filimonas effusa]|uniref:M23ase beta-sheet core domain-containing protein n=1 Tax=Filimonas effusa TaxID=2508721 RepID=A0A4V1MA27_9BACT|nr:M23 family metallopeptidase [Filimonas effusa]RXK83714.1 hypothetical protein ESB13_16675 [Filimonas effusa]